MDGVHDEFPSRCIFSKTKGIDDFVEVQWQEQMNVALSGNDLKEKVGAW